MAWPSTVEHALRWARRILAQAEHEPPPWPPDDLGGLKGEDGRGMTGLDKNTRVG